MWYFSVDHNYNKTRENMKLAYEIFENLRLIW